VIGSHSPLGIKIVFAVSSLLRRQNSSSINAAGSESLDSYGRATRTNTIMVTIDGIECFETAPDMSRKVSLDLEVDESMHGTHFLRSDNEFYPGILLSPKRALGHRDYHKRRVTFLNVDESSSSFLKRILNRMFSKMPFLCGSSNQVFDCNQ
jgi:hypothetical protein